MITWKVKNKLTGEVKFKVAYNNVEACEWCGWKLAYCDVKVSIPD